MTTVDFTFEMGKILANKKIFHDLHVVSHHPASIDYLKAIRRNISWIIILLSCLILSLCDSTEGAISKIPYNKAIGGKENYPQQRVELENSANTSLTNDTKAGFEDMENSTDLTLTLTPPREANLSLQSDYKSITTPMYNEIATTPTPLSNIKTFLMTTTTAVEKAKTTPIGKQKNKEKIPCTCGIFLSSQFSKGSAVPPRGEAVISNSIDRTFACNNVGQKQCQTKCLQQVRNNNRTVIDG